MKLVIDIDEVDYTFITHECIIPIKIDNHIYDAIRGGIVLPEEHGDLIDRSEVTKRGVCTYRCWSTGEDENAYPAEWVDDAEAVIPEDKGGQQWVEQIVIPV